MSETFIWTTDAYIGIVVPKLVEINFDNLMLSLEVAHIGNLKLPLISRNHLDFKLVNEFTMSVCNAFINI